MRRATLTIKATDSERAAWERSAWASAAGDRTLSDWAREVLNRAAKRARTTT